MKIGEIVKDSIRYPFSNWELFLIFGLILVFSSLNDILEALGMGMTFIFSAGFMGLLFIIVIPALINGYQIRIMRSSIAGFDELPNLDDLFDIFINGAKVIVVNIVYLIPLLFILFLEGASFGFSELITESSNASGLLDIIIITAILYVVVALPFYLMSLANMALYDDLGSPFRFREIINKISRIGWDKFTIWNIVNIVICLILLVLGALIEVFFIFIQLKVIGVLLVSLMVIPFILIYISRSAALFYLSEDYGYLECEECGGYYELELGESPEDFEKCQCGGNLRYTSSKPSDNISDGSKSNIMGFMKRRRNFILLGILALVIISIPVIFSQSMPHNLITTEKTLIGTYDASKLESSYYMGKFIVIPPGTTTVKIEYNLSRTKAFAGVNGMIVTGYNTNKTSHWGVPDNMNIIYTEGVSFFDDDHEDKNGTINIDD